MPIFKLILAAFAIKSRGWRYNDVISYIENREILQSVIEKYNTQNNFQEGERSIDIKLSFTREKSDTQLDSYEFISGIFIIKNFAKSIKHFSCVL